MLAGCWTGRKKERMERWKIENSESGGNCRTQYIDQAHARFTAVQTRPQVSKIQVGSFWIREEESHSRIEGCDAAHKSASSSRLESLASFHSLDKFPFVQEISFLKGLVAPSFPICSLTSCNPAT